MKYKYIIFGLISILLLSYNTEAADAKFKISFVVPAKNELTDQVRSYINRELRALHDVELVEKDPNFDSFFISIYPISLKLFTGIPTAIAISYVFQKGDLIEHCVLTGSSNDLKALCENIIARFDTNCLEPKRYK
jgi:hypothetical protein